MSRLRAIVLSIAFVAAFGSAALLFSAKPTLADAGNACKELAYHGKQGVVYQVLFASNGAVQQYLLDQSSHNQELDHDVRLEVEAKYGPEALNAPPLKIVSYRKGDGDMMVPDKAVDSCGRVTHFH